MPGSLTQITKLKTVIRLAQELLIEAEAKRGGRLSAKNVAAPIKGARADKRTRRRGKELVAFRRLLKAERKKGIPVAELAKQHGISTAYIYGMD
jgi:hypothetical protein